MTLQHLHIHNFRALAEITLAPHKHINWFYGANGAGKTSVLEAIVVLAKGRSFRGGTLARLIGAHGDWLRVVADVRAAAAEPPVRLGVERRAGEWRGRIDGRDETAVAAFARYLPLVLFEPGSHELIEGPPQIRRQFLDWSLFHVKHDYLVLWRRYTRLLRQRNAALRHDSTDEVLDALEPPLAEAGELLNAARSAMVNHLASALAPLETALGARLGELALEYRCGWDEAESLATDLMLSRAQDRERGHTRNGPHRAELVLKANGRLAAPRLSRGQQKLLSLMLLLAQHQVLAETLQREPLLLLDDPVSELDGPHLALLLDWVKARSGQVWITAIAPPSNTAALDARLFHVEHGRIEAVLPR